MDQADEALESIAHAERMAKQKRGSIDAVMERKRIALVKKQEALEVKALQKRVAVDDWLDEQLKPITAELERIERYLAD